MAFERLSGFAKAYTFVIALLVALSLVGFFHNEAGIRAEEGFSTATNISGRQRMLVMQATQQIYELVANPDAGSSARSTFNGEITATLSELQQHGALLLGTSDAADFPAHIYEFIRELYRSSETPVPELVSQFSALVTRAQSERDQNSLNELWSSIKTKESELIAALDVATKELTTGADERLNLAQDRNLRNLVATLATLLLLGLLIFRPMDRAIAKEKNSLLDANTSLEARVAERTREVEKRAGELERQQTKLQAILDTTVDGIVTTDLHGNIMTFNPAAERIFGYSADDVIGTNLVMLMPEHLREDQALSMRGYMEADHDKFGDKTHELIMSHISGREFTAELAFREQSIGTKRLFTAILRDVTQAKEIQQMKNEFISLVSHELRTPLTSIRGSLGLVAGGVMGELPEKARSLIEIASNNSERLVRLINDILDIEKIEAGKMSFDLKPQKLSPIVQQAMDGNLSYAKKCGVHFNVVEDLPESRVKVHADRIRQVLDNLLSNAIKFSPEGEAVDIAITHEDDHIRVSVTDKGPGVSEDFRALIFEKFSQADSSSTRSKGGTGLGLSISKAIIERHHGQIGYDSEPGKGATFYFELQELPELEAPAVVETPVNLISEVLICEDNADVAKLMKLMFKSAGITADVAYTAQQARDMLAAHRYLAMTLDLMLPDEDGIALLRDLRRNEATKDLDIIVVSAIAEKGKSKVNGAGMHVIDWLSKPIDENRLLEAINGVLQSNENRRPLILHVEDDPDIRHVVSGIVDDAAELSVAASLGEAKRSLMTNSFDLVILDIMLPDGSGLDLLDTINQRENPIPVIIFSAKDVDETTSKRVAASLVKARTSNEQLIEQIRSVIGGGQSLVSKSDQRTVVTE